MIYLITNSDTLYKKYYKKYEDITPIIEHSSTAFIYSKLQDSTLGFDTETNGLDCWLNKPLLWILGNEKDQLVFHAPTVNITRYFSFLYSKNTLLIGANIKFDLKFLYTNTNTNILYQNVYDVMITDQRLYMKLGLQFSLEDITRRYLNINESITDKTIRNDFINCNIETFNLRPKHIYYAVKDITVLFPVREKQEETIEKYKMQFLIKGIEFPLIHIIAKAEIIGFKFNIDKWIEIYKDNKEKLFEIECKLDEEFRRLRDIIIPNKQDSKRLYITGGKWDNKRIKNSQYDIFNEDGINTNLLDLFGNVMDNKTYTGLKKKVNSKPPNNIDYNSPTQIVEIFGRLEQPLLDSKEKLKIPTFNKTGKIDRTYGNFQTNENAFISYLNMLPESIMKDFINLLLEHRGLSTACNNFGSNYISKINPITNKLHTVFRQCHADTGRFQSGGGRKEPDKPNFQNIPSKADYAISMRNCFIADEGYSIGTHDLSGAELIIMCSLSQDLKFLAIAKDDMHSYIAQGSWRRIFYNRCKLLYLTLKAECYDTIQEKNAMIEEVERLRTLSREYIVTKETEGGKVRTNFKPMGFGVIYGMHADKAGKTLNITREEGQIVIDYITEEFPDVIKMVKAASAFATENGYVLLNNRTNSRAWFPTIVGIKKGILNPDMYYSLVMKEQSEARNIRIQGTQADMIKEMTVELQKWIDDNDFTEEITILSWVHDEIVDMHPKYLDGKSNNWEEWSKNHRLIYNDKYYKSFPEIKAQIMRDVANRYLHNVEMEVDYHVEPYWTK